MADIPQLLTVSLVSPQLYECGTLKLLERPFKIQIPLNSIVTEFKVMPTFITCYQLITVEGRSTVITASK